ncbi:LytTR family DNA-binding domain-containing protein, partial [Ruminococcaceae bacterium OttesenSCG-928-L11]|nr:LytTR family DNA-binding domain-containing protein [Ruminococcaceae bacterium OttesenSCG-928-L11]
RRELCEMLTRYQEEKQVAFDMTSFQNSDELMRSYEPGRFQILFMDIYMDGTNGMEAARKIRTLDQECALIFTTVSTEHALDGFAVRATHYLNKPLIYDEIEEAMSRCEEQVGLYAKSIELAANGMALRVRLRDIIYVEVFRKSCVLHTVKGDMTLNQRIDHLEEMLGGLPFLRCHRSYIVNLLHVRDVEEHHFVLSDGSRALIPIRSFAAMKKAFHDHRFAQMAH